MNPTPTPIIVLLTLVACSPVSGATIELWEPPLEPSAGALPAEHPLATVHAALQSGDCVAVVAESQPVMARVRARVRETLHPDAEADIDEDTGPFAASEARAILDEYVYADPPVLEVGPHRFVFSHWWSSGYAYCLTELERYDEATDVYASMLQERLDADTLWRWVLVTAWADRPAEAAVVLAEWPAELPEPAALSAVLDLLQRGERLPRRVVVQHESQSPVDEGDEGTAEASRTR